MFNNQATDVIRIPIKYYLAEVCASEEIAAGCCSNHSDQKNNVPLIGSNIQLNTKTGQFYPV